MNATRINDEKTINGRATRLLARHAAMGFTKAGKPMVIDQAFELVAAEEGYRNQHELRAAARKRNGTVDVGGNPGIVDAQAKAKAETIGENQWHDACNRMGWDEDSQIVHLEGFLTSKGLMAEFGAYAQEAAAEEGCGMEACNPMVESLEAVGYSVQDSEFGKPYWSLDEEDEASTDFRNESAAWDDALNHAVGRVLATTGMTRSSWDALSLPERMMAIEKHLGNSGEAAMYAAANEAYENYNFGDHLTVAGDDGWLNSATGILSRTVFVADDRHPDADTVRYRFAVEVVSGKVVSTNVTKL